MFWRRAQRFAASIAASTGSLIALGLGILSLGRQTSGQASTSLLPGFITVVAGLLLLQARFEYERRTHDPTWALKYQKIWDESKPQRRIAAKALQQHSDHLTEIDAYKAQLAPIDDVLDVLEDIGFYMEGNQISPETANHHFGHWIQGYWTSARPYIKAWQTKDPTRWEHIEPLFQAICSVAKQPTYADPDFLALEMGD